MEKPNVCENVPQVDNLVSDNEIFLFNSHDEVKDEMLYTKRGIKHYAIVLCQKGNLRANVNGVEVEIKEGDLIVCNPNSVVQIISISDDFEKIGLACAANYAVRNLSLINPNSWNIKYFLDHHPIIHIDETERAMFLDYLHLIDNRLTQVQSGFRKRIVEGLLTAFFLELGRIIQDHNGEVEDILYTSAEVIFHRFISILDSDYPHDRSVESYAKRLCITPKYLSAVCKKVTGRTALHIIGEYVVKDIRCALLNRDKTIKEISFELNFPNLSFFGKYVKEKMGECPRELRRKLLSNAN